MARNDTPRQMEDEQQGAEVALINDRSLVAMFAQMATMIPANDGDATEQILRQVLSAESWEQLNEPWQTSDIDDILGKTLKITKVTRQASSFAGGLGVFLVLTMVDIDKGDKYVKTTGSIAIVGQVARAYALGAMPLIVKWVKAERPSSNGYYPQHLVVLASGASSDGAAA